MASRSRVKLDVIDTDRGWRRLRRIIFGSGRPEVTVGIHGAEKGRTDGEINNVGLAAIHEFGAPLASVPERSFIRLTVDEKLKSWERLLTALGGKLYALELSTKQVLDTVGLKMASDMQRTISKQPSQWEDLKPATIARKASNKALIDTRELLRSIKHQVSA